MYIPGQSLLCSLPFSFPISFCAPPPPAEAPESTFVSAKLGAVATESSICSTIGIDVLRSGGNAADALVATVACIGVVGMYHSGIGGGGFMLVRKPGLTGAEGTDGYEFIDFRETAPAAATEDMYNGNVNASLYGGLAR
jgi:gamma-glutamyltranspeptidase / glutathione hydrolase